jgi:glycerol-3-phosphate cytidylyltransferase
VNVWTGGTFDLFHPGHAHLLQEASKLGRVTVAVNTSGFASRFKDRPVQPCWDRLQVLQACRYVSVVQINDGIDQAALILEAKANCIVIGDDWKDRDYLGQLGISWEWLTEHDIEIVYVPRLPRYSSTELKAQIRG